MCAHAPETRSFISGSHLALNLLDGFLKFDNDFLLIFKIFLGFQRILGRSWSRPRRAHERHGALQTQAWRVCSAPSCANVIFMKFIFRQWRAHERPGRVHERPRVAQGAPMPAPWAQEIAKNQTGCAHKSLKWRKSSYRSAT